MTKYQAALAMAAVLPGQAHAELAHVRSEFRFTLDVPYESAAPLFGALKEQKWDPEWKPEFLYPDPPADQAGAIFRVDHGSHSSLWTTDVFDLPGGRVQYVSIIDGVMLTRIDIRLSKTGAESTGVSVAYERTALDPGANPHVRSLAANDAGQAPHWKAAIEHYWKSAKLNPGRSGTSLQSPPQ